MTVDELVAVARRYILVLLAGLAIGAGLGITASTLTRPTYIATAKVMAVLADGTTDPLDPRYSGGLASTSFIKSRIVEYTTFASTESFLRRVIETNHLPVKPGELARDMTMTSPKDSSIIMITVRSGSPVTAADVANATANVLARVIPEREPRLPMRATVAEGAVVPRLPAEPQRRRIILQCSALGFIFAAVVVGGLVGLSGRRQAGRVH